ncbi:MotA/TolQ/ExbB proton channel family protein [Sphingomonas jatrophae]|uniref:Chemotaxis protein MotA n=1 Tax=Sphingomonas jatrophae TaxID=1166337 RepID=A0A1I6MAS7_9SPHN|nr:MotA/TolQ/ExbB proton channel family protein [Sphingomonas jatrophae]SFS12820.1 chemotaxis protein MotA [Sphingomonas jatrophae]
MTQFWAEIGRYLDPLALLLVIGGAFAIACFRSTGEDRARAFAALGPLFRADPARDGLAALRALSRIEARVQLRTLAQVDRVAAEGFLRRAARRLADAPSAAAFVAWGEEALTVRSERHAGAIGFWRAVADAAPAMGMIGTVVALVAMFARMEDAAAIGPAMALAMLTTLYGVVLSGAIAGPIAARLERLSEAEAAWQRRAVARLARLAHDAFDLRAAA